MSKKYQYQNLLHDPRCLGFIVPLNDKHTSFDTYSTNDLGIIDQMPSDEEDACGSFSMKYVVDQKGRYILEDSEPMDPKYASESLSREEALDRICDCFGLKRRQTKK